MIWLTWSVHVRDGFRVIPSYLYELVWVRGVSLRNKVSFRVGVDVRIFVPRIIISVFFSLMDNLLLKHQFAILLRSDWYWEIVRSWWRGSKGMYKTVSSAYINILENLGERGRLLT